MNRINMTMATVFLCLVSNLWADQPLLPKTAFTKQSALYYETGALRKCELTAPILIQGYPCQHWVWFHQDGRLEQCQLSEDKMIQDIPIPADSTVFLDAEGTLKSCWLAKDTTIQELPCNGGFMKVTTYFHKNGTISCCFLSASTEIQDVPCAASVFKPVYLYDSGRLKTCTLSRDYTAGGKTYKKGTTLNFDETGSTKAGSNGPNEQPAVNRQRKRNH